MTEEDIKQFAAALAVRYQQVRDEYIQSSRKFALITASEISQKEFQETRALVEQSYAKWTLFNDVLSDLPLEIMQAFQREYEEYKT
ncbi:hypothetical protein [Paenibacillus thiaminolyticus]|uniref:Uncharacterized protein n=1 Tax=Paenibacillus thiaminolyticus TaxID=49283 RepID=A0A3A3GSG2_PANTH|nr:hypothetical protein [Paenibacillus thiaminolyticus]RJG26669.1 hypothetical protein DQX05_01150 [Paenibacillus thiaminolyticus]